MTPEPGSYSGISFDEYRLWPFVSSSKLRMMGVSPQHYRAALEQERESSDAQRHGSFLHAAVLEHEQLGKRYAAEPDFDIRRPDGSEYANLRATKEYKQRRAAFLETVGDRELVPAEWFEQGALIHRQALDHPLLRDLILDPARLVEESVVFDTRQAIRCKARFDLWVPHRQTIVDLKTTRDLMSFEGAMFRYGYHVQAAFYVRAAQIITGAEHRHIIAAVEKEPPYGLRAAPVDPEAVALGQAKIGEWLTTLAECVRTNHWPGPPSPELWRLPSWAMETHNIFERV